MTIRTVTYTAVSIVVITHLQRNVTKLVTRLADTVERKVVRRVDFTTVDTMVVDTTVVKKAERKEDTTAVVSSNVKLSVNRSRSLTFKSFRTYNHKQYKSMNDDGTK